MPTKTREELLRKIESQRGIVAIHHNIYWDTYNNAYETARAHRQPADSCADWAKRQSSYQLTNYNNEARKLENLQQELDELPEEKVKKLKQQMASASTESELRNFAREFRKINALLLADECEKKANGIAERERQRLERERQECERIEKEKRERRYNELLSRKKNSSGWNEFEFLAKEFRDMQGYKDTVILSEECDKLAATAKGMTYMQLLRTKENEESKVECDIVEFRKLIGKLLELEPGYKDVSKLVKECERIVYAQEQKDQYNALISRKNNASSENYFQDLANEFRAMRFYQDAATLAKECENCYHELKIKRIYEEYKNALAEMQRYRSY